MKEVSILELKFDVTGMTCAACSARVEKVAGQVAGVEKAEVNLLAGSLQVQKACSPKTKVYLMMV